MDFTFINNMVDTIVLNTVNDIGILIANFFTELCKDLVLSSYWICLIGGVIGLILYIFGYKKGKSYPLISIAIYLIINIIGRAILNV